MKHRSVADGHGTRRGGHRGRPGREHGADAPASGDRSRVVLAWAGYLAFVVYGSLVPLRLQPLPVDIALERFAQIQYLSLGIGSRADWVANILLFVPLACLPSWLLSRPGGRGPGVVGSLTIWVACAGLSVAIEFAQLFFPPRTVSANDLVAETLGAAAGLVAWRLTGSAVAQWFSGLRRVRGAAAVAERLLVVYLVVFFAYSLLPLDLSLSPVELYRKWRDGRVILLPFSAGPSGLAQRAYELGTDVIVWAVPAALWRWTSATGHRAVWWHVVLAAALLELLQLLVYSRVTDSTDIITAGIGAAIGIRLAALRPLSGAPAASSRSARPHGAATTRVAPWALALLLWLGVVLLVFWYPFDFVVDPGFVRERLLGSRRVAFEAYYFGTEFRAVTEVLHKTLFVFPIGFAAGGLFARDGWPRGAVHAAVVFVVAAVALLIEAGQLLLPAKIADATDLVLEFAGGVAGYLVFRALERAPEATLREADTSSKR